jgi:hypothetical protein
MSADSLARLRDRTIADIIDMLDLALDVLTAIPPNDGLDIEEYDTIRDALIVAADCLAELRESLQ